MYGEYMVCIDMNENIVSYTNSFNTKILRMKLMQITAIFHRCYNSMAYTVVSQVSAHGRLNITRNLARMDAYLGYKFHMFIWKLHQ